MSYISLAELLVFLALLGPRPALADRRGVLRYSTFLGTNFADGARALVTTADDGLWVASDTRFFSVQTQDGPIQYGSANITRWNSDGIRLFTSEVVGSYLEKATGVALGEGSSIWICGSTNSYNLEPASVAGGAQKMLGGKTDGFVARYSQTALLEYISFWGGSATDVATGLADVNGGVWVVGSTNSVDFPIRGAPLQATLGGQIDMSFAFFNRTGGLVISGVLGGSGDDAANAVAIYPPDKSVWLVGSACSSDFPQSGTPFQSYSGNCDAAIVHLSSAGHMLFSAVIGGADEDSAAALTVNPIDGSVWVAGYTSSLNFPRVPFTATPLQGPRDAFVLRFQSDGTLMLALVLGGSSHDAIFTIALNPLAGLWVAGATNSSDFPSASSARTPGTLNEPQPRYGGRGDGFLALLDDKGMLAYSSYLGGSDEDAITGIHLQKSGNVWAVGQTRSAGGAAETPFPTTWLTAAQRMHAGGKTDGFLAEVLNERTAIASVTLTPNRGIVRPGATVLVDVTVVDEEEGLTSTSASRINGRAPSFATGDVPGVYQFSYVIAAEDPWWAPGRLPLQLELMDLAGIKASVTAATDGNTLAGGGGGGGGTVGASAPSITGLVVDPPAGVMSEGAVILVTLFAANNETALMAGPTAMIAGVDVRTTFAEVVGRPGAYRYSLTVPAARLISYNFPTQPLPLLLTLRDYAGNEASVAFGFYTPPALSSSPLPPGATAPRPAIGMPPGISAPPPVMVPPVDGEGDSGGGGSPRWLVLVLVIVVGSLLVLLTIAGIALYVRLKRRRERLDFEEGTAWNPVNPTMAPLPAAGELGISKEDKGGRPKLGRRSSDGVLLRKVFDDEEAVGLTAGVTSPFGSSPMAEAPLARAMTNPMTTLDLDEVDLLDKYRSQAMSPLGGSQPATYLQPLPETLSKAEIHRLLPPGEGPSVELPSMDAALRLIEEAKSVPPVHTSRGPPGGASGFPPGAGLGSRGGGGGGPWPGARVGEGPPQDRPYEQGGGAGGVSYGSGNQDLWDSSGPSPSSGRHLLAGERRVSSGALAMSPVGGMGGGGAWGATEGGDGREEFGLSGRGGAHLGSPQRSRLVRTVLRSLQGLGVGGGSFSVDPGGSSRGRLLAEGGSSRGGEARAAPGVASSSSLLSSGAAGGGAAEGASSDGVQLAASRELVLLVMGKEAVDDLVSSVEGNLRELERVMLVSCGGGGGGSPALPPDEMHELETRLDEVRADVAAVLDQVDEAAEVAGQWRAVGGLGAGGSAGEGSGTADGSAALHTRAQEAAEKAWDAVRLARKNLRVFRRVVSALGDAHSSRGGRAGGGARGGMSDQAVRVFVGSIASLYHTLGIVLAVVQLSADEFAAMGGAGQPDSPGSPMI